MSLSILTNLARSEMLALVPKSSFPSALQVLQLRQASSKAPATQTSDNNVNLYREDMEGRYSPFKVSFVSRSLQTCPLSRQSKMSCWC